MALGHKWDKRLKGGGAIASVFTHDRPHISWSKWQRLKRTGFRSKQQRNQETDEYADSRFLI